MTRRQQEMAKKKARVLAELPDIFSYQDAKRFGKEVGVHYTTIINWGKMADKTLNSSNANRDEGKNGTQYTDGDYLKLDDEVVIVECIDGTGHRNRKGALRAYNPQGHIYTVELQDGTYCTASRVLKWKKPEPKPKRERRNYPVTPEFKKFIFDYREQHGLTWKRVSEIFNIPVGSLWSWNSKMGTDIKKTGYSAQQAEVWAKQYGIYDDIMAESSQEAPLKQAFQAQEQTETASEVQTPELDAQMKENYVVELTGRAFTITDGDEIYEVSSFPHVTYFGEEKTGNEPVAQYLAGHSTNMGKNRIYFKDITSMEKYANALNRAIITLKRGE